MGFVDAYDTRNGVKQRVPEQWLDIFDHISSTPRGKKARSKSTSDSDVEDTTTTPATGDDPKEYPDAQVTG